MPVTINGNMSGKMNISQALPRNKFGIGLFCQNQVLQTNFRLLLVGFFVSLFLFTSCKSNIKEEESARKEVMDLHDQVMLKMEEIYSLKAALSKMEEDSSSEDSRAERIRKIKKQLTDADEAMMNWMRNYSDPDESKSHDFKMSYYYNEKKKMESVKILMEQSIDSAKQEIEKIRNSK